MRSRLTRTRLVRPQLGWGASGGTRRVWGWTRLVLTPGRLVLERRPVRIRVLDLDRRRVLSAREGSEGVVEVHYEEVARPWASLVDQDREVTHHTLYLYVGQDAAEWAGRLERRGGG